MHDQFSLRVIAVSAILATCLTTAQAFDDTRYPDLSGQWLLVRPPVGGQPPFDPLRPWGKGQEAPLTPEYEAVLEASLADQANGGQGGWRSGDACMPPGMPGMMNGYGDLEIVVLPEITYFMIEHNIQNHRRIHTDGRDWPAEVEPSYRGYSIGKWIDSDGTGRFDILQVETRHLKGPRTIDPTGMPTHSDNQSVIRERIFLSKEQPGILHDEVTLIDNAFTRPWTVFKTYRRDPSVYPLWQDQNCPAVTAMIKIGKELYYKGAEGELMPTRKDQAAPDLRYFRQSQK
jgi:hypothetical protein